MKDLKLLIWITQLGLSVAVPIPLCILLSLWFRDRFGWGSWVVVLGIFLGLFTAIDGLRTSLKAMERMSRSTQDPAAPPVSFHDHT